MAKKSKVLFEVSENGSIASPSNKLNNKKNKKNQKLLFEVGEDGRTTNFDLSKQGTQNTQKKQYVGGLFKGSSLFDDGYQFGDVTKTVGSSVGDLASDISEGFLSTVEGVTDWAQYKLSDVYNFIGDRVSNESIKNEYKNAAEKVKKNAEFNSTASLLGKSENAGDDLFKTGWSDSFEENSVLGDTSDMINQGIGNVAAMVGMSYLGTEAIGSGASSVGLATNAKKVGVASSILSSYTSAYGNARSNAYANGADDKSAHKAGVISGIAEAISEQIFEGIPGLKVEGWGSKTLGKLAGKIEKSFGTKTGKIFMKIMDATGEGAEEIISNFLTTTGTYIANIGGNYEYGMQDKTGNYIKDVINDLTSEDSWKSFFSAAMTSALIGGSKTTLDNAQKNIILKEYAKDNGITYKEAKTKFENTVKAKNDINLPFNERIEAEENISKQELQNMKNGTFVAQETPNLPISKENQKFNFDSSKVTDEFEKSVYESAAKNLNNTEETHQFVDKVAQIAKDKKSNYGFINNEELKTSGYNIDGKEVGGLVVTNENGQKQILINIDSPKALNSIVGHETTHLLEGTKEYQELQQSIFEYAKEKGEFDTRQQTLTELYKDIKNADINSEMTADLVGDYLFTDEKFINSLSTKKPSLFQRIKDLIDDLVVRFKGTKEEKLLREVQKKFKAAYQQEGNIEGNKYMMIGKNGVKTGIQTNQRYNDIKDRYFEAAKMERQNATNEEIRQKTGWFKDNKGNWEFEISDRNTEFKEIPQEKKKYKLSEIFDAKTLFELYPELKDLNVEFKKIGGLGNYSDSTKTITISKKLLSDLDSARGTLLHEIQHYIQRQENFPTGTTIKFGNEHYANSKGEIEAADVKRRRNLTVEQRKNIIPESAKENPVHPNRNAILKHKRNIIEKITEKLYNKYGDKINGVDQENFLEDIRKTSESMVEAYLEDGGLDEELIQEDNGQNRGLSFQTLGSRVNKDDNNFSHEIKEKQTQNSKENSNQDLRQTDNNDRVKRIDEQNKFTNNKNLYEELDDSSFNLPLSEQLERQGTKILEAAELKRQGMIDNFKEYLEEHNITHPTQEDIDNSITDIMSYDNEQSSADNARDEKLYNQYVREYMEENNIPFEKTIQGLENYTRDEIKNITKDYINQILEDNGMSDVNLVDIDIHGSRNRGTAKSNSDLDIVVQYDGDIREDDLFNMLNDNGENNLYIDGIQVDINPIQENIKDYMKRSNEYDKKILDNTVKYSLSHDNQGRELSKQQQKYFKNSKIRDENNNLVTVYHTMTDEGKQFNEFDPLGTPYYKFGDQIVNYFTDSKDMSGSYANQDYIMADTKKITSMKEVKNYIKEMNESGWGRDYTYELIQEDGKYKLIDNSKISNTGKTWQQIYDEANEYKENLTEEEYNQFKDMFDKSGDYDSDGRYNIDRYLINNGYEFGSKEDTIAQKYLSIDNKNVYERGIYFDALFRNSKHHTVETFDNKEDLFKKIKSGRGSVARFQYEGYVNITNPYVVDAEKRNWNQVISQSNDFIDDLEERVPQETKDKLTKLYQESANKSSELRDEFNVLENAVRGMWNSAVDEDVKKVNEVVKKVGYNEIEEILNDIPTGVMGVNGWYNLADVLKEQGIVGDSTAKLIIDDFKLPEQIKEYIQENYNKEIPIHKLWTTDITKLMKQLDRNTTLKDIYNINQQKYLEFDKYRYPESYFLEAISSNPSDPNFMDIGNELNDMFETRAEIKGANVVAEEIAQAASVGFSKPEMIRLWGTSKTTNDVVKEVIASNKDGTTDYDGVIIKNVYDYGGKSENGKKANNLYITFSSNQFKAADNIDPTIDDDIRYSLSTEDSKQYGDYNVYGEDVKYQELSEINLPNEEVNLPTNDTINTNEINLPIAEKQTIAQTKTQEAASKLIKDKIKKAIDKESYKAVNTATKVGNSYLDFDRQQKRDFKEHLSDYIGKSREELINPKTFNDIKDLVRQYADKEITYVDSEMEAVKKDIKNFKIKVTDELKNQITDYNDFRKSNFGKLQLGNSGTNIDSVYEELSSMYPHYFGEATTEADMLYELSEFMNHDTTEVEKFRLSEEDIEQATTKVYNSLIQNTLNKDDIDGIKEKIEKKYSVRKREVIQQELLDEMGITKEDIARGKDISSIDIARTDPIRLNEKIFGYETGRKINDATINKTKHNEAERTRWLNKERQEIKELGIKARSKESAAVQKYGEKQYIDENGDVRYYGDVELAKEFNDINTQEKIREAAKVLRSKYDTYIEQINWTLTDMGYKPIQKRDDYMRHFQALNDVFSRYGVPLNKESMQSDSLPTDINGLTDQFKPGKQYFASALQRIGMKTEYDAITGIDGYLEGASNLIYHTEDIQRYRTLSKLIRETYGTTHGFDDFANMTEEEQQERIEDIRSNKLAKYASWLDEQANALANKKGKIDRGAEEVLGRKIYNVLDTAKKQVGSNMTGFNVRSALTNFASAIQGASKTNKLAFIKGTVSTINNIIHKDNLIDKSDFLTSRFGSDSLSPKLWQKISNAGQIFMEGTDYFTANQIWRSKYYENLQKGMNENAAIKDADDFSARIMGDRSKGATATLFNSKTLGFFTQFQLEVNNQWSSLIHDNKMDIESGKKTGATVVFQLGQLFGLSYLFNGFMKAVTGSDVMIDPIDLLKKLFNPDDDKDLDERAEEVLGDVIDDLPFVSFLTGGRIPVSEAFKGLGTTAKKLTGQKDNYGNPYEWSDVKGDIIESAYYWLLPTGYGQIRKTKQGLKMYDKNLPIAGSYTDSGKLRFEADTSILGKLQAAAFGQYASKNAREYFDKGYSPLTEKQLNTALDAGLNVDEYRNYNSKIKEKENNDEKIDYIYNLPIKDSQKNVLANSVLNRKEDVDISNYGDYGSLAEFDYANKNPEKYQTITQITDFNSYNNYKDEIASIKEKYTDTNERKSAVFNYINSLKMNKHQKLMLYKLAGGYSIKNYKNEMINYINSLKLTAEEKHTIYDELFK